MDRSMENLDESIVYKELYLDRQYKLNLRSNK